MIGIGELPIYGLTVVAAAAAVAAVYSLVVSAVTRSVGRVEAYQQARIDTATRALDDIFMQVRPTWLTAAYALGPLVAGALLYIFLNNVWLACVGAALGWILPDLWVKQQQAIRRRRFQAQLVDSLFVLSSSLRAGLSLTQAFEVLEEEIGPPASQEFGLMNKSRRLGQTFEEALDGLNQRMACGELNLMTTALLVARETGGDVTTIMSQLIATIREKKKLNDKVSTLTLQGRLQAYIMSLLPVLFAAFVRTINPHYFDPLLQTPQGGVVLVIAVTLWLVGIWLLIRLSKVEI